MEAGTPVWGQALKASVAVASAATVCHQCQQMGHYKADCPAKGKGKSTGKSTAPSLPPQKPCKKCGSNGHRTFDCPVDIDTARETNPVKLGWKEYACEHCKGSLKSKPPVDHLAYWCTQNPAVAKSSKDQSLQQQLNSLSPAEMQALKKLIAAQRKMKDGDPTLVAQSRTGQKALLPAPSDGSDGSRKDRAKGGRGTTTANTFAALAALVEEQGLGGETGSDSE